MLDNSFFKNLINLSSEGFIVTNSKAEIIYANNRALQLFLYSEKELLGKTIESLIPHESRKDHIKLRDDYIKNPINRPHGIGLDVYALRKDNSLFPVEVSLSTIQHNGDLYTICITSDITRRKEKEKRIQKFIVEQQNIKNAHLKSQLEVLKNQISPHYLFNCISILYTLIGSSPEKAKIFIKKISETYGYVLETRNRKWITLSSEINFMTNYVYLQRIRFGDQFSLQLETGLENDNHYIIPLAIQVLIENIFKHNKLSSSEKLEISVSKENDGILVSNSITQKNYEKKSYGVGLENLIKQYRLISSRIPIVSNDSKTFKVWVPIFKNKV